MKQIPFAVGQASGTAVMAVNADATNSVAAGGASTFAGLVLSRRGKIGKVLNVNADNYQIILGKAIHPRQGSAFEPLRHVERATKGGNGYVVRVPAPGMKIPGISLSVNEETKNLEIKSVNFNAGSEPVLADKSQVLIYIDDGDASANRTLSLEEDESAEGFYILSLQETDEAGTTTTLESQQISFDLEARSDMGNPAFLSTALENGSTRLRALVSDDALEQLAQVVGGLNVDAAAFVGGTDGDFDTVTPADYSKALAVLKKASVNFTALLSLGCYEPTVLAELEQYAQNLRVDMFYDLKGAQMSTGAITEAKGHGFGGSHQAARYYFPYYCRDVFAGVKVCFGISCDAFVAKAKGVALVSDVGGWHYAPAGVSRGIISRQNIEPIPNLDEIDLEAFAAARINPVAVDDQGNVFIDDSLTTFAKNNYLRLQHISSLMNAIARGFYAVAQAAKHEPDGVTSSTLLEGMTDLLERFSAANALVKPRDTSQGEEPFVLKLTQKDIDLWELEWAVCPTGTARRIVGKPMLFR
ncbi:phage tail protein [Leclercia adecarboxylata]|uniref:phage tail protein n=1 Tax=Leclercia adecarboxylata TaxID=83655 RepID=UPI001119095A|nr:phage tail protein [Leclercia adecarboxylata]QCZ30170.1 phage tail protein [Leclercia adecarboxylata]